MTVAARLLLVVLLPIAEPAAGAGPPSVPGVDAPELARLGEFTVGVRTVELVDRDQVDVLAFDSTQGAAPRRDRQLIVEIWYPARTSPRSVPETYTASFPAEPPGTPVSFSVPGLAVRNARAAGGRYPLVIVSHGYSNAPAAMSWLTENLASKGYVVAAIRHDDPWITDPAGFPQLLLRRPLDIVFVTRRLQESLAAEGLIDPTRTALIGYSIGGYGVLTAAGATLDPEAPAAKLVPGGLLLPYARGGAARDAVRVNGLQAVVAMAPAGGGRLAAWGRDGVESITTPLLLIAGDSDRTVDYGTGARAIFDTATHSHRYLLTFEGCGHAIGLDPAPEAMRQRLWDLDWFEDPVWRKDRINAISQHMITAFLDRYLKGDESRAAYIDVPVPQSAAGSWTASDPAGYGAYSPGTDGVTVWKGFQRNHALGLELIHGDAESRTN